MNVLVVADGHYYQTPDGTAYAESVYDYSFYSRYLQTFDHVYAAVRVTRLNTAPAGKKVSSGKNVSFLPLPAFSGPLGYAKNYFKMILKVREYIKLCDCAIFRLPSMTGNMFYKYYSGIKKPYAVEIVSDPWENFGPREKGNRIVLWAARYFWTKAVKKACLSANGASYVTSSYLQDKYPPRANKDKTAFTSSYSSVELPDSMFGSPRVWTKIEKLHISHVSNCFNTYGKGHLVLMDAIKLIKDNGYYADVCFVGDGPKLDEFRLYAQKLKISDRVNFVGRLANSAEVRKAIRATDLFVLPTFAEGLPRVLLEAMAEGIPCLSSPVCGIPEILDSKYLFDFDDSGGFAGKIMQLIDNPDEMTAQSERNLLVAKQFSSGLLNAKRKVFYDRLKNCVLPAGI